MDGWFLQHKNGVCFNLSNATGFKVIESECHIFYNGDILHPTLTITKKEYPDLFEKLFQMYMKLSENAPPPKFIQ